MDGLEIISKLNDLLKKGYNPNELADKLDSAQLYECFETLVEHGLKATDELGEKICRWPREFILDDYVYPEFKTNYYVLDDEGLGWIHDGTSLPLPEEECEYGNDYYYYALITIASHVDSILKCGFSKETIAEWFLDNDDFDDDELTPYEVIEGTKEYNNFLKIMSCGEKYVKSVIEFFFSSCDEPGTDLSDERGWSKFKMFVEALKVFVSAGIEEDYLIHCISTSCYNGLAFYFYRCDDEVIWDVFCGGVLDIPIEKVMTKDMYLPFEDTDPEIELFCKIAGHYGPDDVIKTITSSSYLPDICEWETLIDGVTDYYDVEHWRELFEHISAILYKECNLDDIAAIWSILDTFGLDVCESSNDIYSIVRGAVAFVYYENDKNPSPEIVDYAEKILD